MVSTIYTRRQTHHHHHSCRKPKNRHDQNMGIIVSLYSLDQSDTYPLHLFLCTICQNCMARPFTWRTASGILWLTCTHPNLLFLWSLQPLLPIVFRDRGIVMSPSLLFSQPMTNLVRNRCRSARILEKLYF